MELRHWLPADKQVLRHGQVRAQVDFLIHRGNPLALRVQRVPVHDRTIDTIKMNFPSLKLVDPGKALD